MLALKRLPFAFDRLHSLQNLFCRKFSSKIIQEELASLKSKLVLGSSSDSKGGIVLDVKNDIVYFLNPEDHNNLKYLSLLKTASATSKELQLNDINNYFLLLTLNEKISSALALGKLDKNNLSQLVPESDSDALRAFFTLKASDKLFGRVVNYLGNVLQGASMDIDAHSLVKNIGFFKPLKLGKYNRVKAKSQIFTGNIAIDFTNPIAEGNFVVLKGDSFTGKTHMVTNFAATFLNDIDHNKPCKRKVIYVSSEFKSAEKVAMLLRQRGFEANFAVFSAASDGCSAEKFFAPFSALAFARYLMEKENHKILFIFDDVYEFLFSEINIFGNTSLINSPVSMLREMYCSTGTFEKGSMTSVMVFDTNEVNDQFLRESDSYLNEAESFGDVLINFDLKEENLRNVVPKIPFRVSRSASPFQDALHKHLHDKFRDLLGTLEAQKTSYKGMKELKMQIEPWDYYLYFDSAYFLKFLLGKETHSPLENIILVQFTLRALEEDTFSLFKDDPQILRNKLLEFSRTFKEFDKKDIYTYLEESLSGKDLNDDSIVAPVIEAINRLYELFFMNLKFTDSLLTFKKDYFK